jgi:dTDP-4-amino-4,6-dideoxygalactose transaminase
MARVYLSPPHLGTAEQELVAEAFASNWIAPLGPHVDAFEREVAAAAGVAHGAALSSGTAAIHLALRLFGIAPGDDVLCSTLTFAGTVFPVLYEGARPVFLDADRTTWNLDPGLLLEELEDRARAGRLPRVVIAVDLYGQCADYAPIEEACARFGVPLLEDAAEALGATYGDRPAGSFGRAAVLSFNGNKIVTTSGGGMLVSDDLQLIERARHLATQARDPAPWYQHSEVGFNYRLSNVLAAIGRGQMRTLAERVEARRRNFALYQEALGHLPGVRFMPEAAYGRSNRWLTTLTIDPAAFGADRDEVCRVLATEDIEARPVWKPMHLQPLFAGCPARGGQVAEDLFARGLCLPSGSNLADADRARIVGLIARCCKSC